MNDNSKTAVSTALPFILFQDALMPETAVSQPNLPAMGTRQEMIPVPDIHTIPQKLIEEVTRTVLFNLVKRPFHSLKIVESYGRVVVCAFAPFGHKDPVLPVPLVKMPDPFPERFSNLSAHMSAWVDHYEYHGPESMPDWYAQWGRGAADFVNKLLSVVSRSNLLTVTELAYLQLKMKAYVSEPHSVYRIWKIRPSFEASWRENYPYNLTPAERWYLSRIKA